MSKKLIIGIAAGVAAVGGVAVLVNKIKKKKSEDDEAVIADADYFDDDDDIWDDEFGALDDDELYECADPELCDSKKIIDAITQLTGVVENIIDRKRDELYGK